MLIRVLGILDFVLHSILHSILYNARFHQVIRDSDIQDPMGHHCTPMVVVALHCLGGRGSSNPNFQMHYEANTTCAGSVPSLSCCLSAAPGGVECAHQILNGSWPVRPGQFNL